MQATRTFNAGLCPVGGLKRAVARPCVAVRPSLAPIRPAGVTPLQRTLLPTRPELPPRTVQPRAAATEGAPAPEPEQPADGEVLGIRKATWSKVLPLGLMFFCILFNYTILRDTKDVLVVTAPGSGAEVIPFLKTWVNLPLAIAFTVVYTSMANTMGPQALFYTCLFPFLAFFASFAFVIYPLRDTLHPNEWAANLLAQVGTRFAGPISIIRNWSYCLFYVMAELWGSVVISVLFWGCANQVTTVEEAKQFYPLFGLGANVALIVSGRVIKMFSEMRSALPPGVDGWGFSLQGLTALICVSGLIIAGLYWHLQNKVMPNLPADAKPEKREKKKKAKMSVGESFSFMAASPYIRDLAALVVCYGISINLVEVTWKSKIKAQFPDPNDYSAFMGDFSSCTGIVTFGMMIAGKYIFKNFGWGGAALITPVILLITGAAFFSLLLFSEQLNPMMAAMSMTPLMAAVIIGAAQNIFSKSSKYSLFDPCKEMAYIPLDDEVKTKGKAAIDVICNPLGKSGGALIQQFLIIGFGSLAASTPYLGAILLGIVGLWIKSAISLNKQFTDLQKNELRSKLRTQQFQAAKEGSNVRKYKYVSVPSEDKSVIETKYIPIEEGTDITDSMDVIELTEEELAQRTGGNGSSGSAAETKPEGSTA